MTARPNPALRFEREGPLLVVGHIWWNSDWGWKRYLVRRRKFSDSSEVQETTYVDAGRLFCMHCLSNDVATYLRVGLPAVHKCHGCEISWTLVDEPKSLSG